MEPLPPSKELRGLDQVPSMLDQALLYALQSTPDVKTKAKIERRRSLGFGMLALACLCMIVAAVPWPGKQLFDVAMWICFSAVLLVLGGWQIDKAGRESMQAAELSSDLLPPTPPSARGADIKRVK